MNEQITLRQQLAVTRPDVMVKIRDGDRLVYAGCKANIDHEESCVMIMDHYIRYITPDEEVRRKDWQEKGLMPPTRPDETPDWEYKDMITKSYLVIQM